MMRSFILILLLLGLACTGPVNRPIDEAESTQEKDVMNGTDSSAPPGPGPRVHPPSLPEIVSLTIERVPFQPPSYKFVRTAYPDTSEALAFTIEVKGELRLNVDATPVLYVGEVELSHVEPLGKGRYRFLAFPEEEGAMHPEAPISLGWPGHKPHPQTRFRYKSPRD